MGPYQERQRGQQYDYANPGDFSTGICYNRHLPSSCSAENGFEYDTNGMICQQTHAMNGRPILPYPDAISSPMSDGAMFGPQSSHTAFDLAPSQQSPWQPPHESESYYYPPPPQMFLVDDDYNSLAYPVDPLTNQDRNGAMTQQPGAVSLGGTNSTYRSIAPAPAPRPLEGFRQPRQQQQEPIKLDVSIFPDEVVYEHGRTFQAYRQDTYFFPNDPQEQDRLDFAHEVYKLLTDKRLYLAPIRQPRQVLDLGTGTGIWANEFAREHPQAQVLGTDLTMIQPTHRPLPPNVSFIKEDVEENEWSVPVGFDYIHVRELTMFVKDHMKLLRNTWARRWSATANSSGEGLTRLGCDATALERYRALLADVGFLASSIREHVMPMPCCDYDDNSRASAAENAKYRHIGLFQAVNYDQIVGSATFKVLQFAGVSARENKQLTADVWAELLSKRDIPETMSAPDPASGRQAAEVVLAADPKLLPELISPDREVTGKSILEDDSIEIDGRKYQGYKEDRYFLPNDPEEQDRLDMQHAMMTALLDNELMLDVATGTGIWPIEFAQQHPHAEVVGTDLSLIQPAVEYLPPNVSFVKEDAEDDEWTIDRDFDLIHLRAVYTAIKDHGKLIRHMFEHLAPGGWVEVVEARPEVLSFDGTSAGSGIERFGHMVSAGLTRLGRDAFAITQYRQLMREAGFVEYSETRLAEGGALQDGGKVQGANVTQALLGGTMHRLFRAAGLGEDEIKHDIARAVQELEYNYVHGYWPIHVVHARKPPIMKGDS
ncbi:S-adenosyl-L-methionine-dependent methyltransferase [Apiospora phragmitis]|uniref:S-adenosyl-L-methionine-dependent methyltransferase n=1 Tax=Apiospora phragmitis TaxID=2905665 RepID=A0ABR1VGD3_9PEZI